MSTVNLVELVGGLILWSSRLGGSIYFRIRGDVVMHKTAHLGALSDSRVIELPRRSLIPGIETGQVHHLTLTMGLVVAVAGATGRVGRTIVEQIRHENKFSVIGLTRSVSFVKDPHPQNEAWVDRSTKEHVESALSGVPYVQVDYEDTPALVQKLEEHNVQTVICTIGMLGDDCSESQLNLIKAADQATTVQRFITSEFGYMTRAEYDSPITMGSPFDCMANSTFAGGKI